ncbi:MAG: hypothetical protein JXB49_01530 [Bacteroidales bacterium]|nr:hypothetical protein [Bacteroidales bacterium]
MKYFKVIYLCLIPILFACEKDNEPVNAPPVADFTWIDNIDYLSLINNSTDIDGDSITLKYNSLCDTIEIINSAGENAHFLLPDPLTENILSVKLLVSDGEYSDSIIKEIPLPESTIERSYGLGINPESCKSNNVSYNWYMDQKFTGTYYYENCGPTSVTMAIKWVDENFEKTPEDARNTYRYLGGWWYTNDITNYLDLYSVDNKTIRLQTMNVLQEELDDENIAILCLDMYYIRSEDKTKWHIDKFYNANTEGWGHFIVVKGYKIVDGKTFFEVYDPYSMGICYNDEMPKGKDRYYRSEDLNTATDIWWDYAIIVSRDGFVKSGEILNIDQIEHKPGK